MAERGRQWEKIEEISAVVDDDDDVNYVSLA